MTDYEWNVQNLWQPSPEIWLSHQGEHSFFRQYLILIAIRYLFVGLVRQSPYQFSTLVVSDGLVP